MKEICIALGSLILLASCHSSTPKSSSGGDPGTGTVQINAVVSDTLAAKMNTLLHTYYTLRDAFLKNDTVSANEAAAHLSEVAGKITLTEFKTDSVRYHSALASLNGLEPEIIGLLGENTLLGKRQEFQMISGVTYELIKLTGLKGQTVYRDFCPMFNNGDGAYWLSDEKAIRNPYYGTEMPECGTLHETLSF